MFQRFVKNQSGAALMIVLFVVVLVSIVGTAMLSSTTYGLQNVVKTTKEQEEFYRAEGALEIVITEMANYENSITGNNGPYGFLTELTSSTRSYKIGDKDLKVKVSSKEINPNRLEVTLESQYADINQSHLNRMVEFQIDITTKELARTDKIYNYEIPQGNIEKRIPNNIGLPVTNKLKSTTYDTIISEIYNNKNQDNYSFRTVNNVDLQGNGNNYTFQVNPTRKEITKINLIKISGQGVTVKIPAGAIVHADLVDLRGMGNNSQLILEGVLMTNRIEHGGNSRIKLLSGLIAKTAWANSNSFTVDSTEAKGIDCTLIPTACRYINGEREYHSTIDSSSIKFSTTR